MPEVLVNLASDPVVTDLRLECVDKLVLGANDCDGRSLYKYVAVFGCDVQKALDLIFVARSLDVLVQVSVVGKRADYGIH